MGHVLPELPAPGPPRSRGRAGRLRSLVVFTAGRSMQRVIHGRPWRADRGRVITAATGSWTLTLPLAATAGVGWVSVLRNAGHAGLHIRATTQCHIQILCNVAGTVASRALFWRGSNNDWPAWRRIYDAGNILGTVGQSGGTPTGGVIERGANANGEYIRFADGTQICWRTLTGTTGAASSWTYPAAFVTAPVVTGSAVATVLSVVCLDAAPGATSCTLSARDAAGARRADPIHLVATGRWV